MTAIRSWIGRLRSWPNELQKFGEEGFMARKKTKPGKTKKVKTFASKAEIHEALGWHGTWRDVVNFCGKIFGKDVSKLPNYQKKK